MSHKEIGRQILERLTVDVSGQGEIDQPISSLGKRNYGYGIKLKREYREKAKGTIRIICRN